MNINNVFLVWTKYQARVENLAEDIKENLGDCNIVYRENPPTNKIKKMLLYLNYMIKDFKFLLRNKPKNVFIQTPPSYTLLAPILYKKFFNKSVRIICDMHNAMTRNPWLERMGTKKLLSMSDVILVHNEIVYKSITNNSLFSEEIIKKIIVLEDKTPIFNKKANKKINETPIVFFPASFNSDEPINEVFKSAKLLPDFNFILTGNINKLKKNFNLNEKDIPNNITITGWITNEEYTETLLNCDILLGLTLFNDIQMSVSNEGLGGEKVMVLSDTEALRFIYKDGAKYTNNDAESISSSIKEAYADRVSLARKIKDVKGIKKERYIQQINNLFYLLKNM